MRVAVSHTTRLDYGDDVIEGVMDVRLGPWSDAHQRWLRFDLHAAPHARVARYIDGFENVGHLVTLRRPHRYVEVVTQGEVDTLLQDPFALPPEPPAPLTPAERVEYLTPSTLVPPDARLATMAEPFRPTSPADTLQTVHALMGLVYRQFVYERRVTDVSTTVVEVLDVGRGVCQDFAHLMLGLCRAIGIPARYVSGYVATASRGVEESHAWIEAFTPTHGWRGFDPTNNLMANGHHIKIALGRDFRDVAPNRGSYRGATEEKLTVVVSARRID